MPPPKHTLSLGRSFLGASTRHPCKNNYPTSIFLAGVYGNACWLITLGVSRLV